MDKVFLVQTVILHVDGAAVVRPVAVFRHSEDAKRFSGEQADLFRALLRAGLTVQLPNGGSTIVTPANDLLSQLGIARIEHCVAEVGIGGSLSGATKSGTILQS
jgi:hypothetical protein